MKMYKAGLLVDDHRVGYEKKASCLSEFIGTMQRDVKEQFHPVCNFLIEDIEDEDGNELYREYYKGDAFALLNNGKQTLVKKYGPLALIRDSETGKIWSCHPIIDNDLPFKYDSGVLIARNEMEKLAALFCSCPSCRERRRKNGTEVL